MILRYKTYLEIKCALIKYFVDNQIKADVNRPKQFLCDCNLCRNLEEAKVINKTLLDKNSTMLNVIDKIIFVRYIKNNILFEGRNGDIERLEGKNNKEKWKHFKRKYNYE